MSVALKPLPYAENALEPHMSLRTVQLHHGKHQKTYVDKLNALVAGSPLEKKALEDLVRDLAGQRGARPKQIFDNAGQVWNHQFFWESMRPPSAGRSKPDGRLAQMIDQSFGGLDGLKEQFVKAAVAQFGSGWTWLVAEGGRLAILSTANAMSPMAEDKLALIGCDVWEHAYYLDFQNRRDSFVASFLDHLVSWDAAAQRLAGHGAEEALRIMRA
jgi:Fe-Mn family superoxide dismutase